MRYATPQLLTIWTILTGLVSFIGAASKVLGGDQVIPLHDPLTFASFLSLEPRICFYFTENHRLPQKLSDLPVSSSPYQDNTITDGWGKIFVYSPQLDGSVVLSSKGDKGGDDALAFHFSMDNAANPKFMMAIKVTFAHMYTLDGHIRGYLMMNKDLPKSLSDLHDLPIFILDGWNMPLSYSVQTDGSVLLVSNGKSGGSQVFSLQFAVPHAVLPGPATMATQPSSNENGK